MKKSTAAKTPRSQNKANKKDAARALLPSIDSLPAGHALQHCSTAEAIALAAAVVFAARGLNREFGMAADVLFPPEKAKQAKASMEGCIKVLCEARDRSRRKAA